MSLYALMAVWMKHFSHAYQYCNTLPLFPRVTCHTWIISSRHETKCNREYNRGTCPGDEAQSDRGGQRGGVHVQVMRLRVTEKDRGGHVQVMRLRVTEEDRGGHVQLMRLSDRGSQAGGGHV